jgi:hypothetical protein
VSCIRVTVMCNRLYANAYRAKTGLHPSYLAAGQMASMYAIEYAVAKSNSTSPEVLRQTLSSLYLYALNLLITFQHS